MLNCLKCNHTIHHMTAYSMHQQVPYTYSQKNDILGSRLIAWCKLAPTLARQMWRHNYVIGRSEYLISTLSQSNLPFLGYIHCNFCLNPLTIPGYTKENVSVSGCFFWTQCRLAARSIISSTWQLRTNVFVSAFCTFVSHSAVPCNTARRPVLRVAPARTGLAPRAGLVIDRNHRPIAEPASWPICKD